MNSFTLYDINFYDVDTNTTKTDVYMGDYNVYIGKNGTGGWDEVLIPDSENYTESVVGMDGGYYFGKRYKERKITIPIYIELIDEVDRQDIQVLLSFKKPIKVSTDERPYRYIWLLPDGQTNWDKFWYGDTYSGISELKFVAYDPFYYCHFNSLDELGLVYDNPKIFYDSGLLYDDNMPPTILENITSLTNFKLYNAGNYNAKCIITLYGSGSNIKITNHTTNQSCRIAAMSNQFVTIDGEKGQVLNGSNSALLTHLFDGDYIDLDRRFNNLTIESIDNNMNLLIVEFSYKHTYL